MSMEKSKCPFRFLFFYVKWEKYMQMRIIITKRESQ